MASDAISLIGPLSVDRWVAEGRELPGGGALNMAYHWSQLGPAFELFARVGDDRAPLFIDFAGRHGIPLTDELVVPGRSSSIDVEIRADRQPWMDHFVEGVAADFALSDKELERVRSGSAVHAVLVDVVDRELHRSAARLADAGVLVSGDFLDARHVSADRFAATAAVLDLLFVGWPGDPSDAAVASMAACCDATGTVGVITFGADGILVADGRSGERRWFEVAAVDVAGTTVGCGDAFIAAFLAEWYPSGDLETAIHAGRALGAAATAWRRPLPDAAYA